MTAIRPNPKRVLAIDPTSRGFGFVVMESPSTLIDWGVKSVAPKEVSTILKKVSQLIRLYRPEALILEDPKHSRRCRRVQNLLAQMGELACPEGLKHRFISNSRIRKVFLTFGAVTKHQIAHVIAKQVPELAPRLPRYRKPWMSEDYRMSIFDATALTLCYLYSYATINP